MSMYLIALDFSHYQGDVIFDILCKREVAMCYLKCTDGATFLDPKYSRNVSGLSGCGIPFSSYHYFQPGVDPHTQALWFVKNAKEAQEADLIDVEETRNIPVGYAVRLFSFLTDIEHMRGKRPILYTRSSYWKLYLSAAFNWAFAYRLDVAHYTDRSGPIVCLPWDPMNWYLWQFGTPALGTYYGMQTKDVDVSVFNLGGPFPAMAEKIPLYELSLMAKEPILVPRVPVSPLDWVQEFYFSRAPNFRRE